MNTLQLIQFLPLLLTLLAQRERFVNGANLWTEFACLGFDEYEFRCKPDAFGNPIPEQPKGCENVSMKHPKDGRLIYRICTDECQYTKRNCLNTSDACIIPATLGWDQVQCTSGECPFYFTKEDKAKLDCRRENSTDYGDMIMTLVYTGTSNLWIYLTSGLVALAVFTVIIALIVYYVLPRRARRATGKKRSRRMSRRSSKPSSGLASKTHRSASL